MKQIWISRAGGPEVLEVREAPDPVPGPDEVLVRVEAAGVNFADVMARAGKYGDAPPIPCVGGYEVAGEVLAVGQEIQGDSRFPRGAARAPGTAGAVGQMFAPGDRVFGLTRFGGYSSMVCVPTSQLFAIPEKMSYEQAAAVPVNYFTAYLAIVRVCNVQPDETVLIHNAGGGVGVAAIQLARRIGARIIGTASGWKHERLREIGAHELVDYSTEDWVQRVVDITGGRGVHAIIDPVGGRNLKRDFAVMAPLARLVVFGFSDPVRDSDRPLLPTLRSLFAMPKLRVLQLLSNNRVVGGLNLAHLWTELERLRTVGEDVLEAWADGAVSPEIAATLPFDRAAEAHRMLGERRNLGKVVLTP